jgi:hypothetical protein
MESNCVTGERPRAKVKPMGGTGRFGVLLLAGALLLSCSGLEAADHDPHHLEISASPLSLVSGQIARDQEPPDLGALTWLGSLELRSPDPRFGGLSGLLLSADGLTVTAVSDQGHSVQFSLRHDAKGRLAGVEPARIAPLRALDGQPFADKFDRDAEALARLPDGSIAVAFEHNHRIWQYAGGNGDLTGVPTPLPFPATTPAFGRNSGVEAMSELSDGGILALVEGHAEDTQSPAYLWQGGRWHDLVYERDAGFRPTGATLLPDGDVLVVERFFTVLEGVKIRLVRLAAASLRPGTTLRGKVLATLLPPVVLDNMEGIAATRGTSGETWVYLISDDNFSPLQRTLLLHFALKD